MPLPEKPYFTLEDIVARWKEHGCDRDSLLAFARDDLLVFAVVQVDLGSHRKGTRETTIAFKFLSEAGAAAEKQPLRYISAEDAVRILSAPAGVEIAVNALYMRPERDKKKHGTLHLQAKHFTAADLRVSREERDRFEEKHGLATKPSVASLSSEELGSSAASESPDQRRKRRLERFRELGAAMREAGTGWRVKGTRGALASLVREEKQAGRPMSDKTNVRDDLIRATEDQ